uniref:Uncharacterized protein n=1 Tax=Arundo donax TaxID=35708 RepID=A0A0A9GVS6_ARUDO
MLHILSIQPKASTFMPSQCQGMDRSCPFCIMIEPFRQSFGSFRSHSQLMKDHLAFYCLVM